MTESCSCHLMMSAVSGPGCIVENTEHPLTVKVSDELLGHTLDGLGNPTDGTELTSYEEYPVEAAPPDPVSKGCRK